MPTFSVFLVGEGFHDIGGLAAAPPFRSNDPGFLQPVVEQLLDREVRFSGQKVSVLGKKRVAGLKDVLARKGHIAAVLARDAGAELLVFVTDLDGGQRVRTSRQREREIARKTQAVTDGATASGMQIVCVAGVACHTIEAWAMGDLAAVEAVAGKPVELPAGKDPEDLWGKPRDPASNHPKSVLACLLDRPAGRDDLSEIARQADLDTLASICKRSFGPFAAALREVP
jgi:hypothetical protein